MTIEMVTRYGGAAGLSVVFKPVSDGDVPVRVLGQLHRVVGASCISRQNSARSAATMSSSVCVLACSLRSAGRHAGADSTASPASGTCM
jgi:hypothetical protein